MPFYRFIIHGQGVALAINDQPVRRGGFFTTRWAYGRSQDEAARIALDAVKKDWASGSSSRLSPGQQPTSLVIDQAWRIGVHELWSAPNKGNTLYVDTDEEDATP